MISKKTKVLVCNLHYLPGYKAGGVVRSLSNIVERLGDEIDFHIVTFDRDIGDQASYPSVSEQQWNQVGKARVWYFSHQSISLRTLCQLVSEIKPQLIYVNSFFDPKLTQRVLWARKLGRIHCPVLLAPHGEFSPGALDIHRLRKRAYLFVTRLIGLYKGLYWHASSPREQADIVRSLGYVKEQNVQIAINLAPKQSKERHEQPGLERNAALSICFLSRISPMKNLDFAIKALSMVKSKVRFSIYGPIEDETYWNECKAGIDSLPSNISVQHFGQVHPDNVFATLSQHDLFFLPTRGENYGHVIHEALSAGLPVLISDQTPWRSLEEKGVGWALPLDTVDNFALKIDEASRWSVEERRRYSAAASSYGAQISTNDDSLNQNRALFKLTASHS